MLLLHAYFSLFFMACKKFKIIIKKCEDNVCIKRDFFSFFNVIFNYYFNIYCGPNEKEKKTHKTAACTAVSIVLLSSFWPFIIYKTKEFTHQLKVGHFILNLFNFLDTTLKNIPLIRFSCIIYNLLLI